MPYARPTLSALRLQAAQDITASPLPGADGLLSRAVLRVMALVQAGFAWLHYDYLDWIAKQSNPWSATAEYALAWGALVGIFPKNSTTAGAGVPGIASFVGSVGTDIPPGTAISRSDGAGFISTADAVVSGAGTAAVPVAAVLAGAAGNTAVGTLMTLASPIVGVNAAGSCTLAIVGGADIELEAPFKARYLARYAAPPQGGDKADYLEWALAVPGVTRAWVLGNGAGAGTVVVYIMLDQAEGATNGFPVGSNGVAAGELRATAATGDQLTVANAILPVQPVTALVYLCAPTVSPVAFVVATLLPFTPAIEAGVTAALVDMFLRLGQVGGTVDPATGLAWGTIYPSDWDGAIASVPGIAHFTVVSPTAPIVPATGALFQLGATTFSA